MSAGHSSWPEPKKLGFSLMNDIGSPAKTSLQPSGSALPEFGRPLMALLGSGVSRAGWPLVVQDRTLTDPSIGISMNSRPGFPDA